MPKCNATGKAVATLIHYPGEELQFRIKNSYALKSPRASSNRLGNRRACPLPGWRGPQDKTTLDIYANSQRILQTQPDTRRPSGVKPCAVPGRSHIRQPARNLIRRTAAAMQSAFGGSGMAFITLTLPGSSDRAVEGFSRVQGYVQNRLTQYFRRSFDLGGGAYWLAKWEYQRRGALHCHLLIALPASRQERPEKDGSLKQLDVYVRAIWGRILKDASEILGVDLCERSSGKTWKENPEVWQVKCLQPRDVGRYIAKYVSKKEEDKHCKCPKNRFFKMSRPWSVSKAARALLSSLLISKSWNVSPSSIDTIAANVGGMLLEADRGFQVVFNSFTRRVAGFSAFGGNSGKLMKSIEEEMHSNQAGKLSGSQNSASSDIALPGDEQTGNQSGHLAKDWARLSGSEARVRETFTEYLNAGCPREWGWSKESLWIKRLAESAMLDEQLALRKAGTGSTSSTLTSPSQSQLNLF